MFFFIHLWEKRFVQSKLTMGSEFRAKFPTFNGCLQRPRFAVNENSLSIPLRRTELWLFCRKITGNRAQNQQGGAGRPLSRCCDCDKVPNVFCKLLFNFALGDLYTFTVEIEESHSRVWQSLWAREFWLRKVGVDCYSGPENDRQGKGRQSFLFVLFCCCCCCFSLSLFPSMPLP